MIEMNFKHVFVNNEEDREWLTNVLRSSVVSVLFTKKDGSERKMNCTLDVDVIPSEFTPKGAERAKPVDSLAVFDVEKNEWRSFRWDSIKTVTTFTNKK